MDSISQYFNNLFQVPNWYWAVLAAYLLGSIPNGLIITKLFLGYDVREQGSGNIGMSNVMRTGGKLPGIFTFIGDFGKGALGVWLSYLILGDQVGDWGLIAGIFAVLGHTNSLFLMFKGGKGVAVNFGIWLILDWRIFLGAVATWALMFSWKKVSSLSSMTSALSLPIITGALYGSSSYLAASIFIALYIIFLHKDNIDRLLHDKEGQLTSTK